MAKKNIWIEKGKWSSKKEAQEVLAMFKKDYKKAGIPTDEIRLKKLKGKYRLQQLLER